MGTKEKVIRKGKLPVKLPDKVLAPFPALSPEEVRKPLLKPLPC